MLSVKNANNPIVSVIIPAYNSEKTIQEAVKSFCEQDFRDKELIVVDDGSCDQTAQIVRGFSDVRYLRQENAGPAAARNLGAKHARGDILCFSDADCIAQKDWVKHLISGFISSDVGAVAGSYGIANHDQLLARCIHEEIIYRHKRFKNSFVRCFGSYNCAIKREIFESLGGFDSRYRRASGEDNDLSYKIIEAGHKIYFQPRAIVNHHHETRLEKYLKDQFRHGYWRAKMYLEHPGMTGGDDYTFWKDMTEVLGAYLVLLLSVLWVILPWGLLAGVFVSLLLFFLELGFSLAILKRPFAGFYFAGVMFFRSFARTLGLTAGIIRFIPQLISKKN